MKKKSSILIGLFMSGLALSQTYNWPCQPFDEQHLINGTFCECRGNVDHFHDGIDIHLSEGNPVYSVLVEVITSIGTPSQYGANAWVRAGRYAYVHVIANSALSAGDSVEAFVTVLGWTNSLNHIHFKDGYPGSETNAIRVSGGISPLSDTFNPHIDWVHFYQNNSTIQFPDNRIYGIVDIVCDVADRSDEGPYGDNNGIYKIGYEVLNQAGEIVFGPRFPFQFDNIPSTDDYTGNVYFTGSNNSTHIYIVTNNLQNDYYLNVSDWDTGYYTARIMAYDPFFNADTAEISFEVVPTDTTPPQPPLLEYIIPEGDGFQLKWLSNQEEDLAGYRLYYSFDFDQWQSNHGENILVPSIDEFHTNVFSNSTGYFKMTAVDNAPLKNISDFSNIVVFRKNQNEQGLLLIDAYSMSSDSVYGTSIIGNAGVIANNFDIGINTIHSNVINNDSTITLPEMFTPIVFSGDKKNEWPDSLITFLKRQEFCTIGTQVLTSLNTTEMGSDFLDSLGISLEGNISPPSKLIGNGEPFIDFTANEIMNDLIFDSINVFTITPGIDDVIPVIQDSVGNILAVASVAVPFIMSAIPLELFDESTKFDYFFRITSYLTGITAGITNEGNTIPEEISLGFYPNPFNDNGFIQIHGPQGEYSLHLYNILGQMIWQDKMFVERNIKKRYRIPAEKINKMSSGIYFIHVASPHGNVAAEKILYLK